MFSATSRQLCFITVIVMFVFCSVQTAVCDTDPQDSKFVRVQRKLSQHAEDLRAIDNKGLTVEESHELLFLMISAREVSVEAEIRRSDFAVWQSISASGKRVSARHFLSNQQVAASQIKAILPVVTRAFIKENRSAYRKLADEFRATPRDYEALITETGGILKSVGPPSLRDFLQDLLVPSPTQ